MPDGSPPPSDDDRPAGSDPLRAGWRHRPHPDRLAVDRSDRDAVLAAHRRAAERGDPGYLDPATGLFVLTSVHLRDRGWCCDRGCRHCPYVGAAPGPTVDR